MDERDIYQLKVSLNDIIFNHDFAKAFWYKENTKPQPAINFSTSIVRAQPARLVGWQNHLQIMVVEENPIKYIERYL